MQFAEDPAAHFGHDGHAAHMIDPAERERLQQEALGYRLEQLLPRLAPLQVLADAQGLDANVTLDDAPRLFYPHSIYKSYDPQWLEQGDFHKLTRWASRLIAKELTLADDLHVSSVDEWLAWLEEAYDLDIGHSSGTSGQLSLVFRDACEADRRFARIAMQKRDWYRSHGLEEDESDMHIIWPGPMRGRSVMQKVVAQWGGGLKNPAQIASLYDSDLGADFELHVTRLRVARERGVPDIPEPTAHVQSMLEEAERRQRQRGHYLDQLFEQVASTMAGKRMAILGGPLGIYAMAVAGNERGLSGKFAASSMTCRLGGLKGNAQPDGMEEAIGQFVGTDYAMQGYGMSELNAGFLGCEAGRYHVPPWIVPFVLDPENGCSPKPRSGRQHGRAAYLDIATRANWGGLVTADLVTMDYGKCECGRTSPSLRGDIARVEDEGSSVSYVPAETGAMQDALAMLASFG